MHVRRGDEVSMSVEGHAIGATGTFQKQSYLAGSGVPPVNPVIGLVSEEHVPAPINRGAFREAEAVLENDELPARTPRYQAERIVDIAGNDFDRRMRLVCRLLGHCWREACQGAQHCHENACVCLHTSSSSG